MMPATKRYEYQSLQLVWREFQPTLNKLGAEGWRLVNTELHHEPVPRAHDRAPQKYIQRYWIIMEREVELP